MRPGANRRGEGQRCGLLIGVERDGRRIGGIGQRHLGELQVGGIEHDAPCRLRHLQVDLHRGSEAELRGVGDDADVVMGRRHFRGQDDPVGGRCGGVGGRTGRKQQQGCNSEVSHLLVLPI